MGIRNRVASILQPKARAAGRRTYHALLLIFCFLRPIYAQQAEPAEQPGSAYEKVEHFLSAADFERGYTQLKKHLEANPEDCEARMGAAIVASARALERMGQALYQAGVRTGNRGPNISPLLPVMDNPNPEPASYEKLRLALDRFVEDLGRVERELVALEQQPGVSTMKLKLRPWKIHFDLNGDGRPEQEESLAGLFSVASGDPLSRSAVDETVLMLDLGDVYWLHGYCRLLTGWGRCILAYDEKEFFERVGHLSFKRVETRFTKFREQDVEGASSIWNSAVLGDFIGAIHLINFPLKDKSQMQQARKDFIEVVRLSNLSWDAIEKETDDDREWIPSPKQTSLLPGMAVSKEQVMSWRQATAEIAAILEGKKLTPYWRGRIVTSALDTPTKWGVNIKRFFDEPSDFDLVLFFQGTGVDQYLEEGELSTPQQWQRLSDPFGGNFFPYAFWFN